MKKFVVRLFLCILPFAIFLFPFGIVAIQSKEIFDFDDIIKAQKEKKIGLVGMGYSEQTTYYKLKVANESRADVIALGTSRVMQIREDYFKNSFYNCGGAVSQNFDEYLMFLQKLSDDELPEVIILGLDSWIFNDEWNKSLTHGSIKSEKKDIDEKVIIKQMIKDYFDKKWTFEQFIKGYANAGFNGIIKGNGYKEDGSYCYTDIYREPELSEDYKFVSTLRRVNTGTARFEYGEEVDRETLEYLDELLKYCYGKGIKVVAFIPPFAPTVLDKMMEINKYGYIIKCYDTIRPYFEKYNFELYDFLDVRKLGCDDSYFVDGFHGGSVAYGMMLMEMCEEHSVLESYIDVQILENLLENRFSNMALDVMANKKGGIS